MNLERVNQVKRPIRCRHLPTKHRCVETERYPSSSPNNFKIGGPKERMPNPVVRAFGILKIFGRCIYIMHTVPTRLVDASTILGFAFFGAATIRVTTLQIHLTKKLLKYFFFVSI